MGTSCGNRCFVVSNVEGENAAHINIPDQTVFHVQRFVGERSDPACVRRRVTQVVNLQTTFKRRASLPAGHLLREELALSIMGISIGTILTISIVSVVAFKELQERGFFSKKKGSKSKANVRASSKKQQWL